MSQVIKDLQSEASKATDWFKMNNMIVNPDKFQAIIIDKTEQNNDPTEINIDVKKSILKVVVLLSGLEIDSKLNFDKHAYL